MRTFTSEEKALKLSHPALKHAAGSNRYVLTFEEGAFKTDNDALADALVALALAGVVETTPKPEPKPEPKPVASFKAPKKAKKDEE